MNKTRGTCTAAIGSVTAAMGAQRALASNGIESEVVALSPQQTRRGCAWGVEFNATLERAARATLHYARISVSQYIRET